MKLTATTILSYVSCPREAWFQHHNIIPDQNNPYIELGRFIHESSYKNKGERSIELPGIKVDLIWKEGEFHVIGEVKKSSRSIKGARIQLLYYMYMLNNYNVKVVKGYILIPTEKKKIEVKWGEREEKEIKAFIEKVKEAVSNPLPSKVE